MLELENRGFLASGATAESVKDTGYYYFGNEFAQNWWQYEREAGNWGDTLTEMIDAAMLVTAASTTRKWIDQLQRTSQKSD